ncbi:MAG: glycosyltransferase family 2 protein [Candidatus Moranbacteria bacterium]|nr:glycosyltransferase family 2 protein [Candidatus Moranbacteria bacterium]
MDKISATIFFPLLNGISDHFEETLNAVRKQKVGFPFEIVAIDTGSTDGTVEFLEKQSDIRFSQIPNSQFSHGGTRQKGAEMAKGEFVVFLTQDATPTDESWLGRVIKNFEDPEVVGVCSRVIPRKDAHILKKIEVNNDLSGRKERIEAQIKNKDDFEKLSFPEKRRDYYFFNDVSSAVRKDYILRNPLPAINFAEDVEFAKYALADGKKIIFEPEAVVRHSHDYKILKTFKRNLVDSEYHKKHLGIKNVPALKNVFQNVAMLVRRDWREMKKYNPSFFNILVAILYSPLIHFAEQLGQYKGTKD